MAACNLPPPAPQDGVGLMQLALSQPADRAQHGAQISLLWNDQEYHPRIPGVYAMKYMMVDRDPDRTRDAGWYATNHPDWVALKCDGQAANEFRYAYGFQTPLDITNPQVRAYLETANLGKVLTTGRFDAVAVDNLNADNTWGRCGARTQAGVRKDFTGVKVDPAYTAALADWMQWLKAKVNAAGLCLAGNDYFDDDNPRGFLELARALDIVVDEHGWTRNNRPSNLDAAWLTRTRSYRALPTGQPLVIVDYPARTGDALADAGVSWSLANFLLIKTTHTYLAMTTEDRFDGWRDIPALAIKTGAPLEEMRNDQGLFSRRFANALAIVNPSSTVDRRFTLPPGAWRGLDGRTVSDAVDVPPASALVLTR